MEHGREIVPLSKDREDRQPRHQHCLGWEGSAGMVVMPLEQVSAVAQTLRDFVKTQDRPGIVIPANNVYSA